ncbi:STAS/SEC14 domain-containing protein [Phenylobacterium sp.]|uniref:STAS/SEC14 domain-containing protein n=1 Tax=Phenylobacterium sp. TaxID=1871053 RepID=UPI002ED997EB
MLEVLQAPDHVAAFAISGTLTGEDYDRIVAEVEARLARHERIGVLLDLTLFEDFTAEAAWKDLRYDLSKLFELKRFPREAVISGKQWMRIAASIANPILPHVEIRVFDPGAREEAMQWVSEV